MGPRAVRALRGTIAASVSTFVAAASHSVADGQAASLFAVCVALTASVFVCIALVGRDLSRSRLSVAVLLSQLAYHGMFAFAPPGGTVERADGLGPHAAHVAATVEVHAQTAVHHHGAGMWSAHVIAALVTIAALVKGETVVRSLFETLRVAVVALLLRPVPVVIGRIARVAADGGVARLVSVDLSSRPDRGPPAFA